MPTVNIKDDPRPALPEKGWAHGSYVCACASCKEHFFGEKRAYRCADCAYAPEPEIERYISTATPVTPYQNELLTILIEECSEVIQRACKMQRFGTVETQPGQPEDNMVRLSGETGDLEALIHECVKEGLMNRHVIDRFVEIKPRALQKYMQHRPE